MNRFNLMDRVLDTKYGRTGTVHVIYRDHVAVEGYRNVEWLEAQEIPFTEPQLDEPWYGVLSDTGGSFLTCEGTLQPTTVPAPEKHYPTGRSM